MEKIIERKLMIEKLKGEPTGEYGLIYILKEKYPKYFLDVFLHREVKNNELVPIGLFMCMKCNKPIHHKQFAFGRVCASCDVGKDNPKWTIIRPGDKTDEN